MTVSGGDDDDGEGGSSQPSSPSAMDYLMHSLTIFWKVLFAFVPPTGESQLFVSPSVNDNGPRSCSLIYSVFLCLIINYIQITSLSKENYVSWNELAFHFFIFLNATFHPGWKYCAQCVTTQGRIARYFLVLQKVDRPHGNNLTLYVCIHTVYAAFAIKSYDASAFQSIVRRYEAFCVRIMKENKGKVTFAAACKCLLTKAAIRDIAWYHLSKSLLSVWTPRTV